MKHFTWKQIKKAIDRVSKDAESPILYGLFLKTEIRKHLGMRAHKGKIIQWQKTAPV